MYDSAIAAPRFKSSIEAIVDPEEGLYLFSEHGHVCLSRTIFSDLAPLLDGTHAVEDIFDQLCQHHASADILAALDVLKAHGFLAEGTSTLPPSQQAFWELAGVDPAKAEERLAISPVDLTFIGRDVKDDIRALLEKSGLRVVDRGALSIVVTDTYLAAELAEFNTRAIAENKPWVLLNPGGVQSWLGPAFVPGETACWECLAHRLRWHRRAETYIGARAGRAGTQLAPDASAAVSPLAAMAELVAEVARWIGVGGASMLANRVVSTNSLSMERQNHILTRRPQCPVCGDCPDVADTPRPPVLRARPKVQGNDGGHRSNHPRDLQALLERSVSPITGVVGSLKPGLRSGHSGKDAWVTPTYSADHNFSDCHDDRFFLREGLRRRSGGKGRTPEQARISAVAESLERYSGVFDGTEPRRLARFKDLDAPAILPNECQGYSARQYANRTDHNRRDHKAHWVAEPFDAHAQIDWTPLWRLSDGAKRYLPTSMCYFGYPETGPGFGRADSNGCAAGSTIEEAILQGLLELIERDSVAIWWYNRLSRPGIDVASSSDTYGSQLVAHYQQLNRTLSVVDVTSDIRIPAFAAISARTDKAEEDIIYGFGCHLDPEVALSRALTEVNQSLEAVPKTGGTAAETTYLGTSDAIDWWQTTRLSQAAYLVPDGSKPALKLDEIDNLASDDVLTDIETCVSLLKAKEIDVLVLDQTRPDVNLPVVRVVAPGLRHFWARFGPGRLYDVPVDQGWLSAKTSEEDLNPHVIQF